MRFAYLVCKSGFFPKFIGILVGIGGIAYFISSFMHLLVPDLKAIITFLEIMTNGEILFMLWVMVRGAKIPKHS